MVAGTNYSYKLLIALGVTPLLYVGHTIDRSIASVLRRRIG